MIIKKLSTIPVLKETLKRPALQIITNIKDKINGLKGQINITLQDFNNLLAGNSVSGYSAYSDSASYKIVEETPKNKLVFSNLIKSSNAKEVMFANIVNSTDRSLPENTETEQTFLSSNTPSLSIRYFNPVVTVGSKLTLEYYVDTRYADRLNNNCIGDTFTTIIKDKNDNILYKETTYAGEFVCQIQFFDPGETWFSIQTINNHGVGSAVQFFDILVKQPEMRRVYQMTAQDLTQYSIVPNNSTPAIGYRNKVQFTSLFAKVKADGYNEIKLWNPGGNTVYYFDCHKKVGSTYSDLGTHNFYIYEVKNEEVVGNVEIKANQSVSVGNKIYQVGSDIVEWIWNDGAKLYRSSNDKIKVFWKGTWFDPAKEVVSPSNYLRTYRLDYFYADVEIETDAGKIKVPRYKTLGDGFYYVVTSTVPYVSGKGYAGGDYMKFPDNFTIDLNGSTWQAITCYDIRLRGSIVSLELNTDTHVKNGKLKGMYQNYCFPRAHILQSLSSASVVGEHINVTEIVSSKYCSIEDMDISYAMGYEGVVASSENITLLGNYNSRDNTNKYDPSNSLSCQYPMLRFNKLGYIDYSGQTHPENFVETLRPESPDREIADSVSIIYTNTFTPCNPRVKVPSGQITRLDEITIEPGGYKEFMAGKHHEVFVHFYDQNYRFIKTVKTSMYYLVKVPEGAQFIKLSAYGLSKQVSGSRFPVLDSVGRNKSLEHLQEKAWCPSKNNWFKNCSWHDTRTIAVCMSYAKGQLWDNCTYTRIAIEPRNDWFVTKIFGDFEEGWHFTDLVSLRNCTAERGFSEETNDYGQRVIAINCARNLEMLNCTGIGIEERGGVETALYYNNEIPVLRIDRSGMQERPTIVYKNIIVDTELKFTYRNNSMTRIYTDYGMRYNRCDDDVLNKVYLAGIQSVTPKYGTGGTLIMINEKNCTLGVLEAQQ